MPIVKRFKGLVTFTAFALAWLLLAGQLFFILLTHIAPFRRTVEFESNRTEHSVDRITICIATTPGRCFVEILPIPRAPLLRLSALEAEERKQALASLTAYKGERDLPGTWKDWINVRGHPVFEDHTPSYFLGFGWNSNHHLLDAYDFSFPLLYPALLFALPLTIVTRRRFLHRRRTRRQAAGHCPACNYDCHTTPTQCPECGQLLSSTI